MRSLSNIFFGEMIVSLKFTTNIFFKLPSLPKMHYLEQLLLGKKGDTKNKKKKILLYKTNDKK